MNTNKVLLAFALLSLVVLRASSQATYSAPRINAAVDDSKLTVLRGNTHPLAQAQFDHGPAPANLPMQHMLLVLKRSPAQEAALQAFMSEQLDPSSPEYHHWLTPVEYGQLYGPAQQDITVVTKWLEGHGFQVNNVANGRMTIDFSGNAAQVQSAFHTAIHQYAVKGKQHWANSSDPSIPTALTPVVAGIQSLNSFFPKPAARLRRASVRPGFTFNANGCDIAGSNSNCFTVGPNDFAKIYNVQTLWDNGTDGTGQTIAIVGDSNINLQDVAQFRLNFGLPANVPNVIEPDGPVAVMPPPGGDEMEAALDTEWSGGVAKGATIDLVIAPSTQTQFGGNTAATYIVNCPTALPGCNVGAVPASILSESFGDCEFDLGTTGNQFYSQTWQQAAMEGITVVVASGDQSAASCDTLPPSPTGCGFAFNALLQTARCGLAVNGLASTPYNIAVGGTDFNDLGVEGTYWNTTPGAQPSALGYVPEDVWNDTCTNALLFGLVSVSPPITNAVESCSDSAIQSNNLVTVGGSAGGVSNCTNGAASISGCSGGNTQPAWQTGLSGVQGSTRNLPDVSLFAGDGLVGHFYVMCEEDAPSNQGITGTGQDNNPCVLGANPVFTGVGGTSASVQAFAGIMALVDQKHGSKQGNAGSVLYPLAARPGNTCTSAGSPAATCMFYDITMGTNSAPCTIGSVDCTTTASLPGIFATPLSPVTVRAIRIFCALGIGLLLLLGVRRRQPRWVTVAALCGTAALLIVSVGCGGGSNNSGQTSGEGTPEGVLTGYNAGTGYDLTTGLGSVNATNLVNATLWAGVPPAAPPATIDRPVLTVQVAALAIICALCLGFLFVGLRRKQLRWTTAVLLLAFALSILSAARTSASTRPHHAASRAPAAMRLASFTGSHR
jgi:Pro-kumamolisin, activation domain/Sodium/calcium exchanger protein